MILLCVCFFVWMYQCCNPNLLSPVCDDVGTKDQGWYNRPVIYVGPFVGPA